MITGNFAGSCEPINPGGTGSYAFIVFDNDNKVIYNEAKIICPSYFFIPNSVFKPITTSVNVSDYCACILLLTYLLQNNYKDEPLTIFGDSKLVVNQLSGEWKIGQGHYLFLAHYCKEVLVKLFKDIKFQRISTENNFIADTLSKNVLRDAGIEISNWKENPGYWMGKTKKIKKEKKLENE
jgi:ribonuclease HI